MRRGRVMRVGVCASLFITVGFLTGEVRAAVERLIGSIRRECLDHVVVLHERHLRRLLTSYFSYYHAWRTHRALNMDAPIPRPVHPPALGPVREVPEVGGLHHHYERRIA